MRVLSIQPQKGRALYPLLPTLDRVLKKEFDAAICAYFELPMQKTAEKTLRSKKSANYPHFYVAAKSRFIYIYPKRLVIV